MKLSVSIPDEDVEFIDRYAGEYGVGSRSGVLKRALSLLRANELGQAYAQAWDEWEAHEAEAWEATAGDGLTAAG
ncbi:MAG TPA: ribbon-helix-helix domain-containing protein [Acidimicrobiales bacterium]|nr:ribbon-helix-helix domain-containing protein [Acidimicrobiales bacterium]